jgi:hypothetical protein
MHDLLAGLTRLTRLALRPVSGIAVVAEALVVAFLASDAIVHDRDAIACVYGRVRV